MPEAALRLLHDLQSRAVSAAQALEDRDRMRHALEAVGCAGSGRHPVLQPIVDLVTGRVVAAEGLTRVALDGLLAGRPLRRVVLEVTSTRRSRTTTP